jgi:hypothetical protein
MVNKIMTSSNPIMRRFVSATWTAGSALIVLAIAWLAYTELPSLAFLQPVLPPQPGQVIVEWTTASEVNTAGFNLYRADRSDGSYERVNSDLIPSATDPMIGSQYAYTDTHVISGQMYYYQLEDVEYSGTTTRHGPLEARAQPAYSPFSLPLWWGIIIIGGGLLCANVVLTRRQM